MSEELKSESGGEEPTIDDYIDLMSGRLTKERRAEVDMGKLEQMAYGICRRFRAGAATAMIEGEEKRREYIEEDRPKDLHEAMRQVEGDDLASSAMRQLLERHGLTSEKRIDENHTNDSDVEGPGDRFNNR
jgi:hypothetical protein